MGIVQRHATQYGGVNIGSLIKLEIPELAITSPKKIKTTFACFMITKLLLFHIPKH